MVRAMRFLVFIFLLALAPYTGAQQNAAGWAKYANGDFHGARAESALAAQQENRIDDYALACRSGLVVGGFLETGKNAVASLHQALRDCELALERDPDHYVASLSHAIAIGFEGLRLRKASYARTSRREIERLISKYPDNALALGALAGWHAAVAREGWLARLFLSASRKEAGRLYDEAVILPGAELPLLYEHIRFLADGNADEKARAVRLIEQMIVAGPGDGLGALLISRSRNLLDALKNGRKKTLQAAIDQATPFSGIDDWGKTGKSGIDAYPLPKQETAD